MPCGAVEQKDSSKEPLQEGDDKKGPVKAEDRVEQKLKNAEVEALQMKEDELRKREAALAEMERKFEEEDQARKAVEQSQRQAMERQQEMQRQKELEDQKEKMRQEELARQEEEAAQNEKIRQEEEMRRQQELHQREVLQQKRREEVRKKEEELIQRERDVARRMKEARLCEQGQEAAREQGGGVRKGDGGLPVETPAPELVSMPQSKDSEEPGKFSGKRAAANELENPGKALCVSEGSMLVASQPPAEDAPEKCAGVLVATGAQAEPSSGSGEQSFPSAASDFTGANSMSHYNEWKRFTNKCKAKCRSDGHMAKAFAAGGATAHKAFELFLQARQIVR